MRVLVVDNDWAVLRSLQILLKHRGHEADCYTKPSKALDALGRGGPPAALVVDLVMPEMDGATFVRTVRPLVGGECRVILISGHTDVVEKTDLEDLGEVAFLPKPLDADRLVSAIEGGGATRAGDPEGKESGPQ